MHLSILSLVRQQIVNIKKKNDVWFNDQLANFWSVTILKILHWHANFIYFHPKTIQTLI